MTEITANRHTGSYQGPDITEPLAASLSALQARGQYELDRGEESRNFDIEGWQPWDVAPGDLVRLVDAGYGLPVVGRVTAIELTDLGGGATTRLTLDVPTSAIGFPLSPIAAVTVDNG